LAFYFGVAPGLQATLRLGAAEIDVGDVGQQHVVVDAHPIASGQIGREGQHLILVVAVQANRQVLASVNAYSHTRVSCQQNFDVTLATTAPTVYGHKSSAGRQADLTTTPGRSNVTEAIGQIVDNTHLKARVFLGQGPQHQIGIRSGPLLLHTHLRGVGESGGIDTVEIGERPGAILYQPSPSVVQSRVAGLHRASALFILGQRK
jgi:hypothetical protein